ncbi:MAG: YkgJ family cysteine cluster protein [Planctomycetes bacterium]|nr:YkgJ family cysteine cluster protein [Planctomycetota bacterium]
MIADVMQVTCCGCGECCMTMNHPPFCSDEIPEFTSYEEFTKGLPDRPAGERPDLSPCFWLDVDTRRCKHYDRRPRICRDFRCPESRDFPNDLLRRIDVECDELLDASGNREALAGQLCLFPCLESEPEDAITEAVDVNQLPLPLGGARARTRARRAAVRERRTLQWTNMQLALPRLSESCETNWASGLCGGGGCFFLVCFVSCSLSTRVTRSSSSSVCVCWC